MKLIKRVTAMALVLGSCATPSIYGSEVASLATAGIRYSTDGHGGSNTMDCEAVKQLLDQGRERLVPILIHNLASSMTTDALIDGKGEVSFGYLCFDLLCLILKPTRWYDEDCGDCGIWAAVRPAYSVPFQITDSNRFQAIAARQKWVDLLEARDLTIE